MTSIILIRVTLDQSTFPALWTCFAEWFAQKTILNPLQSVMDMWPCNAPSSSHGFPATSSCTPCIARRSAKRPVSCFATLTPSALAASASLSQRLRIDLLANASSKVSKSLRFFSPVSKTSLTHTFDVARSWSAQAPPGTDPSKSASK